MISGCPTLSPLIPTATPDTSRASCLASLFSVNSRRGSESCPKLPQPLPHHQHPASRERGAGGRWRWWLSSRLGRRFIIDFSRDGAKLCTEVDGDSHAEQIESDQASTAYLNERGYTLFTLLTVRSLIRARRCWNKSDGMQVDC